MIHNVNIVGKNNAPIPIGKFENEAGQMDGIALIDVIEQVQKAPAGTRILLVHLSTPGGLVEEGDNIYNYLEALKEKYVVNTVQDGPVASIGTKLFAVGQDRKADAAFPFLIHNPWNDPGPGDANHHADNLELLLAEEARLRKFYSETFNLPEEALKPLMDQETTIPAKTLLNLGIATSIKNTVKVMALQNQKPGAKKPSTLAERATALYALVTGKKPAAIKALDLQLADNRVLVVDAPDEDNMVGAPAMIDGQPAADGDYPTAPDDNGVSDVVTVAGGKVTGVVEQPVAAAPPAGAPTAEARIAAMETNLATLTGLVKDLVQANSAAPSVTIQDVEKTMNASIMALKNEIGSPHTPKPAATVYAATVEKETRAFKSIAERLKEKEEARKNSK